MSERAPTRAVRLESGHLLPDAIEAVVVEHDLEFVDAAGFGTVAWCEIDPGGAGAPRRFEGPLDLLSLRGRVRRAGEVVLADWVCAVARATDNGVEVLGGRLEAAECEFVELSLTDLAGDGAQVIEAVGGGASAPPGAEIGRAHV